MANKQTRRSISVRGTTYDKLREYGETHGRSMSDVVEELLAPILGKDEPKIALAPAPVKQKPEARLRFNPPPVQKPRPVLANRVVRAVPPPPRPTSNRPPLPGRPAPTPAAAVVGKRPETSEKDDYRGMKF